MVGGKDNSGPQRLTDAEWDTLFELMGKVLNMPVVVLLAEDDTEQEVEQIKREARATVTNDEAQERDAERVLEDFLSLFITLEPT
jgi:hypothetical protein